MVPLYQSVLSGLLIGLKGKVAGSVGIRPFHRSDKISLPVSNI